MSRLRYNRVEAVKYLKSACPALARFIRVQGPLKIPVRPVEPPFSALTRAINYQQLSGKAAATIHGRFLDLFPGGEADALLCTELSFERLRSAGLSRNKALSVQDLAQRVVAGRVPSRRRMLRMSDQEVVDALTEVRGIGQWTAEMYLIFSLGRPDIMPGLDLAVQKGVQAVYGLPELPDPKAVLAATTHLAPYRSAAAWYFWRASEAWLPA